MKEYTETNADKTIMILKRHLGSVFNNLSKESIRGLIIDFGDEFDKYFIRGQENWQL